MKEASGTERPLCRNRSTRYALKIEEINNFA